MLYWEPGCVLWFLGVNAHVTKTLINNAEYTELFFDMQSLSFRCIILYSGASLIGFVIKELNTFQLPQKQTNKQKNSACVCYQGK